MKALQDALGAVRDRQVQRAWIESAGSRIDAEGALQLAAWVSQGLDDDLRSLHLALAGWSSSVAPTIFERSSAAGAGAGAWAGASSRRPSAASCASSSGGSRGRTLIPRRARRTGCGSR